jgi:hypothetical protein
VNRDGEQPTWLRIDWEIVEKVAALPASIDTFDTIIFATFMGV